ncbi:MAG: acyl-CoA mutase large subunit family protein, partial [Myxococcales bacterium]|nr:acyl-CoA mutase large subunit family protein [Myxococcales bacterium]
MSDTELSLASEFPALTESEWRALAEASLKGQALDRLQSRTYDGILLAPIYARANAPVDEASRGVPGAPPFVRGATPLGNTTGGWDIRQCLMEGDLAELNRVALDELERGATSLELCWDRAGRAGLDPDVHGADVGIEGVSISCLADLERALDGVQLELCTVALDAGPSFASAASLYLALIEQRGCNPAEVRGELGADPLAALLSEGWLATSPEEALEQAASLAKHCAEHYPKVIALTASTRPFVEAGASEAQELACALASGVTYVKALLGAGLPLPAALGQLRFELSVGPRQLEDIAKLRAMRRLWARVSEAFAEAAGSSDVTPGIQLGARMAYACVTQRDPWVNLLRATMAGFSAAVAGASSVTLLPYTAALGLPDEFARRVARNTQLVLLEEAHLAQVLDPAGGSFAMEHLTDELANAAWKLFQEIEAAGGLLSFAKSGSLAERLAGTRAARDANIGKRKDAITGVSEFPNLAEKPVKVRELDWAALNQAAIARLERKDLQVPTNLGVRGWLDAATQGATLGQLASALSTQLTKLPQLPRHRFASTFEELRDKSDAALKASGARPRVFLACIGPIAEHT